MSPRSLVALVVAGALLPPGVARAAWPHDPAINLPVVLSAGSQTAPLAVGDGAGGMIVAWVDDRAGQLDLYAARLTAAGEALWAATGVPVCVAPGDQMEPSMVADGAGGAILAWTDRRGGNYEIFAQRLDAAGQASWTPDGVLVATGGSGTRATPALVPSSGSGSIVTWLDNRTGSTEVFAQHLGATGAPQWTGNGLLLATGAGVYSDLQSVSDGKDGAIVAWRRVALPSLQTMAMAQRVAANGALRWAANGVEVASNIGRPRLGEGPSGGAFLAWEVGVIRDLRAQRLDSLGTPQWAAGGAPLVVETGNQQQVRLQPDGAGGCLAVWKDDRGGWYGQRLDGAGNRQWIVPGALLAAATVGGITSEAAFMGDGAGGGRLAWTEIRTTSADAFAQRFDAAGLPLWGASGVLVSSAPRDQQGPAIVSDGTEGAIVVFADRRDNNVADVYAQRIDRFGYLGNVEPSIVSVRDVSNDQGGAVRVSWTPSWLDAPSSLGIETYRVFRRTAPGVYAEVGAQPALGLEGYSMVLATTSDSGSVGPGTTAFIVRARLAADLSKTWDSPPDSGHSVDNLPPATPGEFAGRVEDGAAHLSWTPNREPDLAAYRLHRGASLDFAPDASNLVAELRVAEYVDAGGAAFAYKLVAVDAHGNTSPPAALVPAGAILPLHLPVSIALAAPSPNPARGKVGIAFALPRDARVRIALYDVGGRRVRILREGAFTAGEHTVQVDLRNSGGRSLPTGLYLVRLECEGTARVRRLAVGR
jgi:hypothetical protein